MKLLGWACLLSLVPTTSAAWNPAPQDAYEWVMWGSVAADLTSTELALSRGLAEGNPLLQNRAVRIGSNVGYGLLVQHLYRKHQNEWIILVPTMGKFGLTGWNLAWAVRW